MLLLLLYISLSTFVGGTMGIANVQASTPSAPVVLLDEGYHVIWSLSVSTEVTHLILSILALMLSNRNCVYARIGGFSGTVSKRIEVDVDSIRVGAQTTVSAFMANFPAVKTDEVILGPSSVVGLVLLMSFGVSL